MNSQPVFDAVRQAISQGDTGPALQTLIAYLEQIGAAPGTLRSLRVVEANFNTAKRKENNGILSFSEARSEYAKANDAILSILEDLALGKKTVGTEENKQQVRKRWLLGGGVLLLLGMGAGVWFFMPEKTLPTAEKGPNALVQCPDFRANEFKVMVLEFQKLSGDDSNPALGIQSRIRELTTRNQLPTDVKIMAASQFRNETLDPTDATALGKNCQADMVVWGQYETVRDSISVDIRYTFTNPNWPPGAAIETFKNISEIKSDRMKIGNLDEAVFRLCTALALHENRMDLAKKWLNKIQQPNPRETAWKKMINE